MAVLVYTSNRCKKAAIKHELSNEIEKLSEKVESDQSFASWRLFPYPYITKPLGKSFRLLAERRLVKDYLVLCFLTILPKGHQDYNKFVQDPHLFCKDYIPDENEISEYIKYRETKKAPSPPPSLSDKELEYLYSKVETLDKDLGLVFESEDWVDLVQNKKQKLSTIYQMINDIIKDGDLINKNMHSHDIGIKIIYRYDSNILFLIAALDQDDYELELKIKDKYGWALNKMNTTLLEEEVAKRSKRSYPLLVFAGELNLWISIQENEEGNLALSPEEAKIFDKIRNYSGMDPIYPIFINGRAGSGKTTILQYLFAEKLFCYLKYYLTDFAPPLYLTYSEDLLNNAKRVIWTILNSNPDFKDKNIKLKDNNKTNNEYKKGFDDSFCTFRNLLMSLLPLQKKEQFIDNKRIDFAKFKNACEKFKKKHPDKTIQNISSELIWHVIRTYIKGMRDEENNYLTPDEYFNLPQKQLTVTHETYELIYDKLWQGWYKELCEKNKLWDDQDLTREVLNLPTKTIAKRPVVFADEAQDFTKNDLELILKLSFYSQRTIDQNYLRLVPYAFAGDPYQTLNPTGFEWDSVQALFYENIVQQLDKNGIAKLAFNYRELSLNYRSTPNIVGFCNYIQLLRGLLFRIKNLKPQKNWFLKDSPLPVSFKIDDPICEDGLKNSPDIVILLPCQEGQEEDYAQNDNFLKSISETDKEGLTRNYLSSAKSKGLEFSRIVLYKFGDDLLKNYPKLFESMNNIATSHDQAEPIKEISLPHEYFMNRLYVAISRAKRRIFVIDSTEAIEKFWNNSKLTDIDNLISFYNINLTKEKWTREDISLVQPGNKGSWEGFEDKVDDLAEIFYESGIAEKDAYKLNLAESNYRRAGKIQKAKECKAIRLELTEQYKKAGDIFLELGNKEKALLCYWNAEYDDGIISTSLFNGTIEQRASHFLKSNKRRYDCESFLDYLIKEIQSSNKRKIIIDNRWLRISNTLVKNMSSITATDVNWKKIYQKLMILYDAGLNIAFNSYFALIAYNAEEYDHALRIWESIADRPKADDDKYIKALLSVKGLEPTLERIYGGHHYEKIVETWESHSESEISQTTAYYIATAYFECKKTEELLLFLKNYPVESIMERLREWSIKNNRKNVIKDIYPYLLNEKINSNKWEESISLVRDFNDEPSFQNKLIIKLIYEFARNEDAQNLSINEKEKMAKFLRDKLLSSTNWLDVLSFKVAGASIERANRIIDAFEFYEKVWKTKTIKADKDELEYAQKRWLVCKKRMHDYLQDRDKEKYDGKHLKEAKDYAHVWRIEIDNIPDYPYISESDDPLPSFLEKSEDSLSDDKIKMIKLLYSSKNFTLEQIARNMSLPIELVKKIVKK